MKRLLRVAEYSLIGMAMVLGAVQIAWYVVASQWWPPEPRENG